jgi:hypothetical protein
MKQYFGGAKVAQTGVLVVHNFNQLFISFTSTFIPEKQPGLAIFNQSV